MYVSPLSFQVQFASCASSPTFGATVCAAVATTASISGCVGAGVGAAQHLRRKLVRGQHRLHHVPRDRAVATLDAAHRRLDHAHPGGGERLEVVVERRAIGGEALHRSERRHPLAGEAGMLGGPAQHQRDLPVAEHRQALFVVGRKRPLDQIVELAQVAVGQIPVAADHASASRAVAAISSTSDSVTISGGLNWVTEWSCSA